MRFGASDVDGEALASKQVLPSLPKPFARQELTEDMLTQRTPEAHRLRWRDFARFEAVVSSPRRASQAQSFSLASMAEVSGEAQPGIPKRVCFT